MHELDAGIVVIGNEILSGKTVDSNSAFLSRELRQLGVTLRRIVVIPDELDIIAETVREFHQRYDVVFTSGGVGFLALIAGCFVLARRFAAGGERGWAAYSVVTGVVFFLAFAGIGSGLGGIGLWPVVVLHAAMAVWCGACLRRSPSM